MSGGVAVDFSALSRAGSSLAEGLERNRTQSLLQALGGQVQAGDYAGAAKTAFDAGDLQTGLSLVKIGDDKAATAQFNQQFPGGLGGIYGASTGAPSPVQPVAPAAPVRAPAFTGGEGASADYLRTVRGVESNGNPNAKNPNSTATGIDQFTAGTWAGLAKKYPELGLTPNGRTDPAQSTRAMERFTADNARALTAAGVPITPGNLYVSHFLGEAGGPRFVRGAMSNPDAPATSLVTPGAAAANRTIFFNRDGSPKTAGAVLAERTSRFGGSAPSAGRVQVASADPSFAPQTASLAQAAAPILGGNNATPVLPIPPGDDPVPPEQRVQVAQSAPQVLAQAGLNPQATAQLQAMPPGSPERIQRLVQYLSHPKVPEGAKEAGKALLANELQLSHLSEEQKAYQADVQQGFKGTTMDWRAAKARATAAPEKDPAEKVRVARRDWQALGLPNPADPANDKYWQSFGSRALGGGALVENNISTGNPQNKQLEKVQTDLGDEQSAFMKASRAAPSQLASIGVMEKLLDDPTLYTGTFGSLATEAKRALASLGLGAADGARANEGFQKLSSQFILDKAGGSLGGGFSNGDRTFIQETGPNIANTKDGNRLILEMAKRTAERTVEVGRRARAYAKAHGGLLDGDFYDEIEQYGQANPVFAGLENLAAAPGALKSAPAKPPAGQRDASVQAPQAPAVGTKSKGFTFVGGNPADPASWRKD